MKAKLFPVLLLLISLFGCNDEDLSPEAMVQGKYEYLIQLDPSLGEDLLGFSHTIEFRNDGTFYKEDVARNTGSDEVLGFTGYKSGTYIISEGKVDLYPDEFFVKVEDDLYYVPKEALVQRDAEGLSESYKILNSYSELEFMCPINALCGYLPVYKKLD